MGTLFRNRNLCLYWSVARPFIRMETLGRSTNHCRMISSFCKLPGPGKLKLKSCTENCGKSSLICLARYQGSVSLLNGIFSRRFSHLQPRTLTFCYSQRISKLYRRQFSKSCTNLCKDESNNVNQKELKEGEAPEWVHPGSREDSTIKQDPELKSILHDMASDFGEDKSTTKPDQADESKQGEDKLDNLKEEHEDEKPTEKGARSISEEASRKTNGVLSLVDIVKILEEDNAQDLCVIKVPKELQYVDYFVVVSGRSTRHIKAMAIYLNKVYKMLRKGGEPFVKIEGKNSDDWMCIDFGDIVVHFMLQETRELYELEWLWTLGPEYDDQYHRITEYQANVLRPTMPTQEELEEIQKQQGEDESQLEEQEGYSVVIMEEGESDVKIADEKKI